MEGWDIEIAFRKLAQRLEKAAAKKHAVAIGLTAAVAILLLSAPCLAASKRGRLLDRDRAKATIEQVLAGDDFHTPSIVRIPKFLFDWRFELDDKKPPRAWPEWLVNILRNLYTFLTASFETIIIVAVLSLLLYAFFRYRQDIAKFARDQFEPRRSQAPATRTLFGLEVTEESLPRDILGSVQDLWRRGAQRQALSLLYRATLSRLIERFAVELHASYTERECLTAAASILDQERTVFFRELTMHWQLLAYAHRAPTDQVIGLLCSDWAVYFGKAVTQDGEPESGA